MGLKSKLRKLKKEQHKQQGVGSKVGLLGGVRANTIANMKPGIRTDLMDKVQRKELTPPLDSHAIAITIEDAVRMADLRAAAALNVMHIGVNEIEELVREICREESLEIV